MCFRGVYLEQHLYFIFLVFSWQVCPTSLNLGNLNVNRLTRDSRYACFNSTAFMFYLTVKRWILSFSIFFQYLQFIILVYMTPSANADNPTQIKGALILIKNFHQPA